MNRVRLSDRFCRRFRKTQVANLALFGKLAHGPNRVLDRNPNIDTVLIIKIDRIHPKPLETVVAALANIFRGAVYDPRSALLNQVLMGGERTIQDIAKFGGQKHLRSPRFQDFRKKLFVCARPVKVSRIPVVHPKFQCAIQHVDRLGIVWLAVSKAHPHAAQANCADRGVSDFPLIHCRFYERKPEYLFGMTVVLAPSSPLRV